MIYWQKKYFEQRRLWKKYEFTKGKKWKLVYYEEYDSKHEAMKNEYSLKKNYVLRNKLKIGKKN